MAYHFIALEGVGDRRIAWHYASEGKLDKETLRRGLWRKLKV
ncbi:hypothetical protein P7H06_25415 [Paenibacillus larvae]|nr:hypothetical protein [Paenibacillus larvae]MDT2262158.1 hypothetical protein [Paenibacillus larvae]